jgi:hypothetical protein
MKHLPFIVISSCLTAIAHAMSIDRQDKDHLEIITAGTRPDFNQLRDPFEEDLRDMEQVEYSERPYLVYQQVFI